MTEDEILVRAREAATKYGRLLFSHDQIRTGKCDDTPAVLTAAQALRDISKPLSELQPVDPDLAEAKACAEKWLLEPSDNVVQVLAWAIKRGRELQESGQ